MMEYVLICFCTLYVEVYRWYCGRTYNYYTSFRTLNVEVYRKHASYTITVLDMFPYIKC